MRPILFVAPTVVLTLAGLAASAAGRLEPLACSTIDRLVRAHPEQGPWAEWAACAWDRRRRSQAVESARRAVRSGDRVSRELAYRVLLAAGISVPWPSASVRRVPASGAPLSDPRCHEVLADPARCEDALWSCGYAFRQQTDGHLWRGEARTLGTSVEERDELERALSEEVALTDRLASEWKALVVRADDHDLPLSAPDGADDVEVPQHPRRHSGHPSPIGPPDSRVTCHVLDADVCRGLVGWACRHDERGRRRVWTLGEFHVGDPHSRWEIELPSRRLGGAARTVGSAPVPTR